MRRRDRFAEVYFYEWSINRWRTSETRGLLSMAGRGIYRELLDLCYAQGSISKDFQILATQVGCTASELEQLWPLIRRHFYTDKHDPERLKNHASDQYRKQFFSYIDGQKRNGRSGGLKNSNEPIEMESTGLSLVESSIVESSIVESSIVESATPIADHPTPTEEQKREWVRVTLCGYPGVDRLPSGPDAVIIGLCLTATHGDVDLLATIFREMSNAGKKPSSSWMWFPKLVAHHLKNGRGR